ncbi:MAG: hypothetical protein ACFFDS_03715 [Candidatus Thorarchaeota archaeon]
MKNKNNQQNNKVGQELDLNNIKVYASIAIVGSMVGILFLAIQKDLPVALIFFYVTLYIVVTMRYVLERRHYKKHKAALASSQFLLLPFSILLMGNYISPVAANPRIFLINIDLAGGDSLRIYFNIISLSMIIPLIVLSLHFNNFYSGRWPAMAINRKIKRKKIIPILFFTLFVFLLLIGFFINLTIDFVSLIFVLIYIILSINHLIISPVRSERARAIQRAPTSTTRRTASTTRQVRSVRSSSTTATRTTRTAQRSSVHATIDPGIDVRTTRKTTVKAKSTKITDKNIFPVGKVSSSELKCIICYMDFDKRDTRRVVLCPHCRYPAHEDEFLNWFKTSKLCARCNKPISTKYIKKPIYRLTTKIYIERVIEKI